MEQGAGTVDFLTDTTFLIDLWRRRGAGGKAGTFLTDHSDARFAASWIAKAEFLRGAAIAGQELRALHPFLGNFETVFPTEGTLASYAELYAALRRANCLLGPHDLWIAVSALEHQAPLLTRNVHEFSRVPGLSVIDYSGVVK